MVIFKLGEEMRIDLINTGQSRKFWVLDRNWNYDFPYTGRML